MFPFDMKAMAELWLSGSQAMLKAQKEAGRAIGQSMQAMMSAGLPGGMAGGGSPELGAASADLAAASKSMMELWGAAGELFQTLASKLPHGEASAAAEATLRSMLDPRAWTGGGEMDDVLARMAEGPRFADLWDLERRYAVVMKAWIEVRRRGLEHNSVVLQAWMTAGQSFTEEWAGHTGAGGEAPDAKAAMALWTATANRVLLETQRSEPFLATQTAMIRASTDLRLAQQELVEHVGRQYGFPTRKELDDVHRTVTELRRELRAFKRAQRQAAAGDGGAAQAAAGVAREAALPAPIPDAAVPPAAAPVTVPAVPDAPSLPAPGRRARRGKRSS